MTKKGESIKKKLRNVRGSLNNSKITEKEAREISDIVNSLFKYIPIDNFADDE